MAGVVVGEEVKKLYNAAANGDVKTIQELLQQDPYLLDVASFACSRNLLHVATMHGQAGIVEEALRRNLQLARDSDSKKWSPLHIAAATGHVQIASKLLLAAPEMRWWRDAQGMNPIHIAAMNGHVELLEKLIVSDTFPAKERVDRGQTALHLCVKHGRLPTLKVLVKNVGELVRAEDDDGETVLHLAVRYKLDKITQYLVENTKVDKKSRNSKGKTPLQILHDSFPHDTSLEVEVIRKALIGRISFTKAPDEIFKRMTDITMVAVILIATMAFQSTVSPPGGVWQEDVSSSHRAGEAVMATSHPKLYMSFVRANTTAFVSSLVAIFLLTTGVPSHNLFVMNVVVLAMWVSLASMAVSYGASVMVITPHNEIRSLDYVVKIVVAVSICLLGMVLVLNNLLVVCSKIRNVCLNFFRFFKRDQQGVRVKFDLFQREQQCVRVG